MSTVTHSKQGPATTVVRGILITAYLIRCETILILALAGITLAFITILGPAGTVLTAALVALLLAIRPVREWAGRVFRNAELRRQWHHAIVNARLADRPPLFSQQRNHLIWYPIHRITRTPLGDELEVRVKRGCSGEALESKREVLAPAIRGVRPDGVQVNPTQRADRVTVTLVRRDPFEKADAIPWPLLNAAQTSVWDTLPLGKYAEGDPVEVETMGGHVLIGGVTGSGKSVCLNLFVAQAALDPTANMIGLDNAQVELAPWAACFTPIQADIPGFIGKNIKDAIRALEAIQQVMETRNAQLLAAKARKVKPGDTTYTVFIDELAYYLLHPDQKDAKQFYHLLLDLLQRGRKAGIRIVAATQRPAAEILNTNLRAQFSHRIAFRVMEAETTQMILGSRDAPAHKIPKTHVGVGYLGGEATRPRRFQGYYLSDDDVTAIAHKASTIGLDDELAKLTTPKPTPPKPKAVDERARSDRRKLAEGLPATKPGLTRSDIEKKLGVPYIRAKPLLDEMIAKGMVVQDGSGEPKRGSVPGDPYRWRVSSPVGQPDVQAGDAQ